MDDHPTATNPIKFGTDGWRGIIADDFTFPNVRRAAAGTAAFLKTFPASASSTFLVGYDRRFFSRAFAESVCSVLQRNGFNVKIAKKPMTTPAMSVAVVTHPSPWGVMITASHNPALYNGYKLKEGSGRSAPQEATTLIESLIPTQDPGLISSDPLKPIAEFDPLKDYETYLRSRLDWKLLKKFRATVVFDHLHGVAAGIPEALFKKSAMTFHSIHAESDPLFGGLHPEPIESNLGDLRREILRRRALVGFAFDGDADRLGAMDEKGSYLTPHQMFPLLLLYCIEMKGWRGKVVQSVSLGALGERIAQEFNLSFEEVPVGFKHIAQRMINEDIVGGGEESGGYAFKGGLPERDGILSALFFLEMLATSGKTPSKQLKALEKRFGAARFKRIDIMLKKPILDKNQFSQQIASGLPERIIGQRVVDVRTGDGVKIVLADGAWVLMRPSGTEPLLRTYAESNAWSRTDQLLTLSQKWVTGIHSS